MRATRFIYAGHCKKCKAYRSPKDVYALLSKDKRHWGNGVDDQSVCRECSIEQSGGLALVARSVDDVKTAIAES